MSSRRSAKVSQAILECVSSTILLELKDPRVTNVTVTGAEVSPDFRSAKIKVSVLGDEKTQALTMRGLESARGFLQSKVAERLETRYTPILKFVLDRGVKLSVKTSEILRDLRDERPARNPENFVSDQDCAMLDGLAQSNLNGSFPDTQTKNNPQPDDFDGGLSGVESE